MRQDDLYDVFVNIDEKFINEVDNESHIASGLTAKSVRQKSRTRRNRLLIIVASAALLIFAFFTVFNIVEHNIYADSGKEFKNFILDAIEPRETEYIVLSPEEEAEIQKKLNSMDHRFAVPDGFMSIDDLSHVYYSEINGYENKKEWLALSVEERNAISQVPEELLKTMPTNALIITCLNYNFLGDIGLIDSSANILDTMKEQYNGLEELCKRLDAGTELLRLLSCFDAKKFSENDRIPSIRFSYLMMILCDKNILSSLTSEQAKEWISQLNRLGGEINKEELASLSEISVFLPIMRCLYFNNPKARKVIKSDSALKNFVVNMERFSGVSRFSDVSTGKLWKIIKEDAWGNDSNDNSDSGENVPYNKLLFLLDNKRQQSINNTHSDENYRCKDKDSFNKEYAAWLDHQKRFKNDDYLILITPDPNKFLTEEEIAAGFEPWASGNELKTEKVCKRAYPVISEAIEPFSIGGVFESTGLTVSTIDTDKITPQVLEQLLCMDSVLNVRIVVKPIPLNPEGNVKQSTPILFAKVAIALGIFIGAGLIIAAIILIVYNHKKRSKVNG